MYSTCLFCHSSLERNELIEHFPVGRRLAFDAAHGRLWVVCRSCERWNLTPLEDRWEAIEECEREFRDSRLRVSTDNIGLCRLADGTELVRIGQPLRPEMAAWRYGDQFHRRRRRFIVKSVVATVAPLALSGAYVFAGAGFAGAFGSVAFTMYTLGSVLYNKRTIARVPAEGRILRLDAAWLQHVALRPSRDHWWELEIPDLSTRFRTSFWRKAVPGTMSLHGDEALAAARVLLPQLNIAGGKPDIVRTALSTLERTTSVAHAFANAASQHRGKTPALHRFSESQRLALEMALHEEDERRALDGELAQLEQRWREAEEIAAIADSLLVPDRVRAVLDGARDDDA